jgi:hypothetical protein
MLDYTEGEIKLELGYAELQIARNSISSLFSREPNKIIHMENQAKTFCHSVSSQDNFTHKTYRDFKRYQEITAVHPNRVNP